MARDLVKTYRLGGSVIGALQGISVEIERGEYLAVTGASGSGKSTFMNLVGALDVPTSGSLQVEGRELGKLGSDQLALYRNEKIGFVFQTFNLLARTSALDNVALPLLYSPRGQGGARDKAKAAWPGSGWRTARPPAFGAFRRPAAARGDRPRAGQRSAYHPCRRADRRARQPHHRGDHLPVRGAERDRHHGDHRHPRAGYRQARRRVTFRDGQIVDEAA